MLSDSLHVPVLYNEIMARATTARRVVDATIGYGGHSAGFLASGAEVLGIDRDPGAVAASRQRFPAQSLTVLEESFFSPVALAAVRAFAPDFILLDLGVSSPQLDDSGRGFTFRPGAPLDMRMSGSGESAAEWLDSAPLEEIRTVLAEYADEPASERLAREIVRRRERAPFRNSDDLVNAVRGALGARSGPGDFARIFQAIRIVVNQELSGLEVALPGFLEALVPGGTLAVISYHSGEDRLVKRFFRLWSQGCICPPRLPLCICGKTALGDSQPRGAVKAAQTEIALNPRARSARLRFFQKKVV